MREYERAWKMLKERGKLRLQCSAHLVPRVKRGIIKEKDQDLVYKAQYKRRLLIRTGPDWIEMELKDFTPLSWILRRAEKEQKDGSESSGS